MSRTKGFALPRIPDSSSRITASVTSLQSIGASSLEAISHEQNQYTSFLGSKRRDVVSAVLNDTVMFDDVFGKYGQLEEQTAPKSHLPLTCTPYNSLHDPHVRHLYVKHPAMRKHLVENELITDELRIKSSKQEIYQKIRSHELLERRELLEQKLQQREQERLQRLLSPGKKNKLPPLVRWSLQRERQRQATHLTCLAKKAETHRKRVQEATEKAFLERELERQKWLKHLEEEELEREKRVRSHLLHQQELRSAMYDRKFADLPRGEQIAEWHKEADILHARMIFMQHQRMWPSADVRSEHVSRTATPDEPRRAESSTEELDEALAQALTTELTVSQHSTHSAKEIASDHGGPDEQEPVSTEEAMKDTTVDDEAPTPQGNEIQVKTEQQETGKVPPPTPAKMPLEPPPAIEDPLQEVLVEALSSMDSDGSGWITNEDVLTALQVYCEILGFTDLHKTHLNAAITAISQEHQAAIDSRTGCLSYQHAVHGLSNVVIGLCQHVVQQAGLGIDDLYAWCQLPSVATARFVWLNRATGQIELHRPVEDQPAIRDEYFEDTMIGMFQEADKNGDGVVDRNEFLQMLQEPTIGRKLNPDQVQELWQLFSESTLTGLEFHQFVPFSRLLILMIYNNQYPSEEEWIELSCSSNPHFWYSKITGLTTLLPPDLHWESDGMPDQDEMVMTQSGFSPVTSQQTPTVPAAPAPTRLGYNQTMSPLTLPAISEESSLPTS